MSNIERKLAQIKPITAINKLDGMDRAVQYEIGGWKCIAPIDLYQVGDNVIYLEPDTFVPHEVAPWLAGGRSPKTHQGVSGTKLRTSKMRGHVTQGAILPLSAVPDAQTCTDLDAALGVFKYEEPVKQADTKGNFPSFLIRTDQERIQNVWDAVALKASESTLTFEVTEKLDGTSITVYRKDGQFGICSRNLEMKADQHPLSAVLEKAMVDKKVDNIALQGEYIGPNIQGNPYKLQVKEFFIFSVFDIASQTYYAPELARALVEYLGLKYVPVVIPAYQFDPANDTVDNLLKLAEFSSNLNGATVAEGLVFKCNNAPMSFKAISNSFLSKEK